jgi:hypothetical protein
MGSLANLVYTNTNPVADNICEMCRPFIGMVFVPGFELPLPAHPGCYCLYFPSEKEPDGFDWSAFPEETRDKWVKYTAWLLREGRDVEPILQPLVDDALAYNRQRAEDQGPGPGLPKEDALSSKQVLGGRVFLDASRGPGGRREYDCVFMQPGRVKTVDQEESNWLIPADVIQSAESMFNAAPSYLDHPELFGFGWRGEPRVANLVGVTFDARWDEARQAMVGGLRLYDEEPGSPGAFVGALLDQMLADQADGLEVPPVGLSATVYQDRRFDEDTGLWVSTVFRHIESVDVVYDAGAGGYVRQALAAISSPRRVWSGSTLGVGGIEMPEEVQVVAEESPPSLDDVLRAMGLMAEQVGALSAQVDALVAQPEPEPEPEPVNGNGTGVEQQLETLTSAVEHLTSAMAAQEEARTVVGMGLAPRGVAGITMGRNSLEQVEAALDAMVGGVNPPDGIRPLGGIRELYNLLSGDFEMTGHFQEDRVYLANVTASTMAQMVANVLNKRVINTFAQFPQWWTPFVTPQDFNSLQQIRWITLGGVGELPTVAEGAAYTELTWDDLAQRQSFEKKGGYLGLTIEAIDRDETGRLTSAPRALAQAAWLTLSRSISGIFTSNSGVGPNVYYDDSNTRALFHSSNSNLGSSALSWASWVATRTAMRKHAEHNSSERLGALTVGKYLLVPPDLENVALQVLASAGEPGTADNDINPWAEGDMHDALLRSARQRVIVVDLWTNTANWAAVADPMLYPTIGLGFRYGRTPEVFSVADPRAGLMFSNDVMPVKVRWFYATGPMDFRGLYKHNV